MEKENQKNLEELRRQYEIVEEEQNFVEKAKKQMEEFIEEWHYYCREEQDVLGEIAQISEGTPSKQKATLALVNQEAENNRTSNLFDSFYEELAEYQKKVTTKKQEIEEQISSQKREVSKDDSN